MARLSWPKSLPLMTSLTKNPHPQPKSFFRVQATRLAASFELLTGLVALTRLEKFLWKAMCVLVFFFQKSRNPSGRQRVEYEVHTQSQERLRQL